jgi:hypothetical protein
MKHDAMAGTAAAVMLLIILVGALLLRSMSIPLLSVGPYVLLHMFSILKSFERTPTAFPCTNSNPYAGIVNSLDCYSYRLIGKLTAFLQLREFSLRNPTVDYSTSVARRTTFSVTLKAKIDSTLTKSVVLRITLNIDGAPITSRTHPHPSHSQNSRLLTSSLSLGVPVPRTTQSV